MNKEMNAQVILQLFPLAYTSLTYHFANLPIAIVIYLRLFFKLVLIQLGKIIFKCNQQIESSLKST